MKDLETIGAIQPLESVCQQPSAMKKYRKPPDPVHVSGIHRGEEYALEQGREAGRGCPGQYRSARDSTSINPSKHAPIDPAMPSIPPA